jgi:NAD(P) transhydrogenase subunit alpha
LIVGVPVELNRYEKRVPLVPNDVAKLVSQGAEVEIEAGMGLSAGFTDAAYRDKGASVLSERKELLVHADIVLTIRPPDIKEVDRLKEGAILIGLLDPFNQIKLVQKLADSRVSAFCMEMIPRTTKAQKLDALSSQANLAGYVAVVLAAERLDQVFPMMMTPAGTLKPARVFVIGAGVAGLQAIATAKRLGARVEAYDTRPVVAEQVQSLGAKFVVLDLGETGETKGGYAKALTDEQLKRQREQMAKYCAASDVVITTAQVFGRKPPLIVTTEMVKQMKHGSVVVDLAAETGGNVECSEPDKEVKIDGVTVIGLGNLPGRVAVDASQMYSANLRGLFEEYWDKDQKILELNLEDEIIDSALITHNGEVRSQALRERLAE